MQTVSKITCVEFNTMLLIKIIKNVDYGLRIWMDIMIMDTKCTAFNLSGMYCFKTTPNNLVRREVSFCHFIFDALSVPRHEFLYAQ